MQYFKSFCEELSDCDSTVSFIRRFSLLIKAMTGKYPLEGLFPASD